jgi:hypothetical protein
VKDHCAGVMLALEKGQLGETYCLGEGSLTKVNTSKLLLLTIDHERILIEVGEVERWILNGNVHVPGIGPICRLDVDGPAHRPCGRSHKHSLQTEGCPDRNLPDGVIDRPDLAGKSLQEVFGQFCEMAQIRHTGTFEVPTENGRSDS